MAAVHLLKMGRHMYSYTPIKWLLQRTPVTIEMIAAACDDYDSMGSLWKFDPNLVYDYLIKNNKEKVMSLMKERLNIDLEPHKKKIKV